MLRLCATHARREAEERRQGRPLSLSCQGRDPPREPLPSLSPPGQDWDKKSQKNKDHIFPCEAERPVLGRQWPCWDQTQLGPDWGQKLSPSSRALLLLSQRSLESRHAGSFEAHPTFPPHLPTALPSPQCSSRKAP